MLGTGCSAWDWLWCLYIYVIQEIKEPLHFACINYTTVVVFIYGIGLVLSCQLQDDLSLYYNMVAANGKCGPKFKESQCKYKEISRTEAHQLQMRG